MRQDFLWGAATSSHQIEGDNVHNDWWQWESTGAVETKEISGKACDHWSRYKEDLSLAKSLSLNSYRFSVEWSRLEPKEGHWDDAALDWYVNLVKECEDQGLLPMLTLHHFTVPEWFAAKGGFTWEHAADRFSRYVERVVKALGARVPLWCTFNEPMNLVVGQYLAGYMPPAIYRPEGVSQASANMLKAHAMSYDLIHAENKRRQGPWRHHPLMVGFAHNLIDWISHRDWHPMERLLTRVARRFYNASWLDAVTGKPQHFGINGLVPYAPQVSEALGRKTVDFIGINYYTKAYLRWRAKGGQIAVSENLPIGVAFTEGGEPSTDMGWALYPAGLARMIRFVKSYDVPIYITESGIADNTDKKRTDYILSHLNEVAKEIENGADVRGFFYWSLLDNFEWIKGFGPRFGLIDVNYQTFQRTVRPSADVYRQMIDMHQENYRIPSTRLITRLLENETALMEASAAKK